jgi:hypothetical protein
VLLTTFNIYISQYRIATTKYFQISQINRKADFQETGHCQQGKA